MEVQRALLGAGVGTEGGWAGESLVLEDGGAPADDGVFEGWGAEGGVAEGGDWAGGCEGDGTRVEGGVDDVEAGSNLGARVSWSGWIWRRRGRTRRETGRKRR